MRSAAIMSSDLSAAFTSWFSRAMIAGGVFGGATSPVQETATMSGTPLSSMVGTSGSSELRVAPVTASGRTLPSRTWLSVIEVGSNDMSIWPESMSVITLAAPR